MIKITEALGKFVVLELCSGKVRGNYKFWRGERGGAARISPRDTWEESGAAGDYRSARSERGDVGAK